MAFTSNSNELPRLRPPALNPYILAALVLVVAIVGGILVLRFAGIQENRELVAWQNRLGLIADSRAADIDSWLDRYFKELGTVATNPSLQLYLTELLNNPNAAAPPNEEPAQATFLQNLLSITADRLGFVSAASTELKSINADVRQPSGVGLAILSNAGKVVVATSGLPSLDDALAKKVADAPKDRPSLIDMYKTPSGQLQMGFVLPIFPIQGAVTDHPAGMLVAIKNVDASFFKLLQMPGMTEKTFGADLLRREGDNVVYLSPTKDIDAMTAQFALNTPDLDAAYALTSTGDFAVKKDRQSHITLMTSRAIARSPWVVMVHIDHNQALADSDRFRHQTEAAMLFALLAMIGGLIGVWYYGTSKRTLLLSIETARLATRLAAQEKLLRTVADNQTESVLIVDQGNIVQFANQQAAHTFHAPVDTIPGKDLVSLMGLARAQDYDAANKTVLTGHGTLSRTWRIEGEAGPQVIRSQHIPLTHIPIDRLPVPSPGVLVIDQDVTEIVVERERHAHMLQWLINTLVSLVDNRDPNAAYHSAGVAYVAHEVAIDMNLSSLLVETAEIAGKLMNIGKIAVPRAVLTKEAALEEDEIKRVRESMHLSAQFLQGIAFDGPVVETLRQAQELFNGSGPLKLKGDDILVTARIIAVSNAFVSMVNARAYRPAMTAEQAIKVLLQDIDTRYDRRIVVALANFIENKHGFDQLKRLQSNTP